MTLPEDAGLAIARAELEAARAAARLADAELKLAQALGTQGDDLDAPSVSATHVPTAPVSPGDSHSMASPEQDARGVDAETTESSTAVGDASPLSGTSTDDITTPAPHPAEVGDPEGTRSPNDAVVPSEPAVLSGAATPTASITTATPAGVQANPVPFEDTADTTSSAAALHATSVGEPSFVGEGESDTPAKLTEAGKHPTARTRAPRRRALAAAVAVLAVAVAAVLFVTHTRTDKLPDNAAFRAAGVTVTEQELARKTQVLVVLFGVQIPTDPAALDKFRRDTAHAVALSEVLAQAAKSKGIKVSDQDLTGTINQFVASQYPQGGRSAYLNDLARAGVTEDNVKAELTQQIAEQRLFDKVTGKVSVTDSEVKSAYDKDPSAYAVPERRQLRHIVVADQATAERVLRELRKGVAFAGELSRYTLDGSTKASGGQLGTVAANQLEQAFAGAAFTAPVGGFFGPVQTRFGWDVGQVERVLPATSRTLAQAAPTIRDVLLSQASLAVWRRYLAQVEKDARIQYADAYRPTGGSTAVPGPQLPTAAATAVPAPRS